MASVQVTGTEPASRRKAVQKQGGIKVTKMIRKPREPIKYTPSAYLAERRLTTEERLATITEMYPPTITELLDIGANSNQKDFSVSVDQALFQPFPSEVVFQQFLPQHTYEFPLNLRNNDRVARHLKITHEDSPYFRVVCQRPAGSKVAPGMEVTYLIIFTPDEKKDYHLELVCTTEREKFVVPVRAVGVRALLDFPDTIHFPSSPVKYSSMKTILVRNVGDKEAKFTLHTKSPYSVTPTSASLDEGQCMQVTVTFLPLSVGDSSGELAVQYDTGESVYSTLHGSSVDVNVRLDRSSIKLENTYIGLSTQRSVTLHNRSKVVVHYQWKAFSSEEEEEAHKQLQLDHLAEEETMAKDIFMERCMHNPSLRDRLPILTHSLAHKKTHYTDMEKFLFSDENITIDPVEGDIWPNSQAEIFIIFTPSESISYSRMAYCDVTGRESRLPLKMRSQGIGPHLLFSFDTLDIQNVFINSAHAYEVILENKGDIDAGYSLLPLNTMFGPFFTFSPSSGVLQSGALQAIQISFCSTMLGDFSEDFQWTVAGSPSTLTLRITGTVIGPTFQFDTTHINYGTISYGFLASREVVLTNTSEIPMTYRLRVSGTEGEEGEEEGEEEEGREFEVKPRSGVLPPNYHENIQIDFVPAFVKTYSTELLLYVAEAGMEIFSLPISAKSDVPAITLETPYLDYGRCFLQYPYTLNVTFVNPSYLPVKYEMQPPSDKRILHYSTDPSRGIIEPRSTLNLPLQIETQVLGEIVSPIVFNILGSLEDPLEVTVRCVGEGPVINVSSTELHWGRQPVLTPLPKTVYLSNESLIQAEFECALSHEKTVFSVAPPSGVIAPQETMKLIVTAVIDDCLRFTDKVTILLSKGVNITISLSAEGVGTTIVSQPPLQPRVDLGPHFCCMRPCQQQFTLVNRGRRLQALSWTTQGFSAAKLKKMEIKRATRDMKDIRLKQRAQKDKESELKKPVFRIIPDKFVLEPYQAYVITLEGSSNEPISVAERLVCHAIIGKNAHKERIMTVDVTADFIAPLTEFNTREISFTTYQPPGSQLKPQMQSLSIQNVSPLPFTLVLMCIHPFSFWNSGTKLQQLELELGSSQKGEAVIQFDPAYCQDRHSRTEESQLVVAYKQHPLREYLSLRAEVHFPNLTFESNEVDFGCILNDTETMQYMRMTNTSPLEVHYKWYFIRRPPVRRQDPEQIDEGVDMQSECETDSLTEAGVESQEGRQSEEDEESEESVEEGEGESDGGGEEELGEERREEEEEGEQEEGEVEEVEGVVCQDGEEEETLDTRREHSHSERQSEVSQSEVSHITDQKSQLEEDEENKPGEPSTLTVEHDDNGSIRNVTLEQSISETTTTAESTAPVVREKQPWELVDDPFKLLRIEQVFDILPLHGTLLPGESQQMQFTFYGYADVATECVTACKVDGGPMYQISLGGEASNVQYKFSRKHIDFGQQLYSQVLTSELVLYNSGKVDMDFTTFGVSNKVDLAPGGISVQPPTGHIPALDNMTLTIHFLPGVPEIFRKVFQIQVAHLQPDTITLVGEGVFPCIGFNLPNRLMEPSCTEYGSLREMAKKNLTSRENNTAGIAVERCMDNPSPALLQLEMESVLVKQYILDNAEEFYSPHTKKGKLRPSLPPYQLEFGYVVYGCVETRRVTLTNTGSCSVSFNTSHKHLDGTGFSLDLGSKVRALPGTPDAESLEFNVQFDPAAVQCPEGHTEALLPFNLFGGPVYSIKLSAIVTKPGLQLSRSEIDFDSVTCGQCKIITMRISNPFHVRCSWSAVTNKPPKKIPKHVPMHVRCKMKDKPPPKYFEVDPPSATLQPGQKMDIRIRFMPSEELDYEDRIPFHISQNPRSQIELHVKGHGSEPRLEFDRQLVEFPAVLPFADGSEAEIVVSNPQPYPIEMYSLEFDKEYLKEEEILRWIKGYDTQKRLFLPPITPGEKLSKEILQAWEKTRPQTKIAIVSEEDTNTIEVSGAEGHQDSLAPIPSSVEIPQAVIPQLSTMSLSVPELGVIESITPLSIEAVDNFDVPPVASAIARYMGVDLSPEGPKAEFRKGIAFIVDGPSQSGRTALAKTLAKKYNAAIINMDELLKEMISNAKNPEGYRLRKFCIDAENERQAQLELASTTTAPSGKKPSMKDVKDKDKDQNAAKQEEITLPVEPFAVQALEDTDVAVPESSLLPVPLPKETIDSILENRLLQQDCKQGVVFDGVESVFISSPSAALRMILEAIHNRKHIYVARIEMELTEIQERVIQLQKEAEIRAKEEERIKEQQKKEEEEKARREMEIDEDDYEALSEEQRMEFDRKLLAIKREKNLIKKREKEENERLEREREEEEKRIAEELQKKKKGKGKKPTAATFASPSRPISGAKAAGDPLSMLSQASFASGMATPAKGKGGGAAKSPCVEDQELEDPLEKKYNYHTHYISSLDTLLADWDRIARIDRPAPPEVPAEPLTPVKKSNRKGSTFIVKSMSPTPVQTPLPEVNRDELGVPVIRVNGNKCVDEVMEDILIIGNLPSPEEILEMFGLGPNGPPIAEPATFQVYPYPHKRMKLSSEDHFMFIAASPDDPNAEKVEPPPPEVPPSEPRETEPPPSSQGKKRSESRQSPLKQSRKKGSSKAPSPLPGVILEDEEEKEKEIKKEEKKQSKPTKLASYRWVIPPHGQRKLKLLFSSEDCGQFDHTLNFEIVGTRQRYQLFCRGQCHVPAICQEPRIIFSNYKKSLKGQEIIYKQYIVSDNLYIFGPLQTSKNRERYKEGQYPENMEKLTISNAGKITAEVSFFFRDDPNGTTYLLDPATMTLDSGQSQTLTMWAYPQKPKSFRDALICCVKHNPEPVVLPITCTGVEPEIRVEKKSLDFKKVLLHRKHPMELKLSNSTLLPVAWKLNGLDQLGEEFSFNQDQGIVQPRSDFALRVNFRAAKPVTVKKAFTIQVSDVEKNMGLMQTETIHVMAEAYDVAMDISFPRGADGGLDFECIFAGSDRKLTMQLKNKGKYDIGYSFSFTKASNGKNYSDMFKLAPPHAMLCPGDKSLSVSVIFHSTKEVVIKDEAILKCKVIDRHVGEDGEVIASIPIKISARAVFSKFSISPLNSVNFGALVVNTRKQRSFTLENQGEFDFKYAIVKEPTDDQQKKQQGKVGRGRSSIRSREGQDSLQNSSVFKMEGGGRGGKSRIEMCSIRTEVVSGPQKLVLGMFTIQPATGTIPAGQSTTVTVDCAADRPGKQEVALMIEISDRHKDDPTVIYHIYGDVLEPAINTTDLGFIFEEHGVCQSLRVLGPQMFHREGCIGVYGEAERRFAFKSVIVGQMAKARFKIINSTKIPCDAKLAISSASSKQKGAADVFDIEPKSKFTIPSHSHAFATVTFKPIAIQTYTSVFEAYPDGYKQRALTFELQGDGNLPQVSVVHPSLKNAKGQPLLLFRRLLTDQKQTLSVSLQNTGTIPATVQIQTRTGKQHFTIALPEINEISSREKDGTSKENKLLCRKGSSNPPLSLGLDAGETKTFLVTFHPAISEKCRGELCLKIKDNQFETLSIQLVGEGYQDDVSVENIHGGADWSQVGFPVAKEESFKKLQPEQVEAAHENSLDFGDIPAGETRQITFTLTNHGSHPVKFQWPSSLPGLSFSPTIGHLHPLSSKDVCVSFRSDKPVTLNQERVPGKIWKIKFEEPLKKVSDWDDRHKTVHWINIPRSATSGDGLADKPLPSPAKKKVIEIETEPAHSVVDDSRRDLVLCVWAIADYVKYKCTTQEIHFTDTLLYQTRVYNLPLTNSGPTTLSYKWALVHIDGSPLAPFSSQMGTEGTEAGQSEVVPFSIEPSSGQIPPGEEAVFRVCFSPLDVRDWEYKLLCSIPHLDSSNIPLEVVLRGKALMPYCHFELEPSDYLAGRQSGGGAEGRETHFDPSSTRVIEFHSCGIGIKIVKRFEIINPTLYGYEFNWTFEGRSTSVHPSSFKCLTPKGFVEPGRKYEMVFEFVPTAQEIIESLWRFSIPSLSQSFLFVGHTTEPAVLLDRAYVNFHSIKLGSTCKEVVYLVNNEPIEYSFEFVKKSCYSSGHTARVKVNPIQGAVKPHSRIPIEVSFTANLPQEFNFNLECRVKRKPSLLHLNVKAGGYSVRMGLYFTDPSGNELEVPIHSKADKTISFGRVPVNERALGQIAILNHGDYNIQYCWKLSEQCTATGAQGCQLVSISTTQGTVEAHNRASCELIFAPPKRTVLKDCILTLEVVNGPTIPTSVQGCGVEPKLVFSPTEIDFGMCFIHQPEMSPREATVVMANHDKEDISVESLFTNQPHLAVNCEPCLLKPGNAKHIKVTFKPTQLTKYEDKIEFKVNGLSKTSISAKGQGVPMKVELDNPAQKIVHLGALRVSEGVRKTVTIINRSLIPLTLTVSLFHRSTGSQQLQEDSGGLSVEPSEEMTLKAKNGVGEVTVNFYPKARVPHFQEEVTMESGGVSQPLFMVTGSCLGQEIQLDTDHVPFGAVWQGSQSSRRILIINSGDIGASFKWEAEKFAPDFSISPTEGYLSPGMEVPLEITFHPQEVTRDISYEKLPCEIEGSTPLYLTLSGVSIEKTSTKEVLHFTTTVRNKETRQLTIHNRSNTQWLLTPIIDGPQWTGPDSISIDPNSPGHYELTYHPLTMTTEGVKHHGSIFFPYPDGSGFFQNLLGTAEPPKMTAQISQEIPCKTPHTELLTVENWTRRPQRFYVIRDLLRPDKLDRSVSLHGLNYIDVPALGKRDYKLHFYSFKECTILAKVTFMIEQTGEYMFYNVSFKSTPSGIVDTIELCTKVRQSLSHHLTITNPLCSPVTFSTSTSIPEISLPSNFIVGAESETTRMFEYLPLRSGETVGKLTLNSSELGSYQYELHLIAMPPSPEPPIHFTCPLGNNQQQQCRVSNYAKGRVEYTCKVDSTDFHVEKSITASGTEAAIEVLFEPSRIGDSQATLSLSSTQGGDYTIPLFGHCLPPRPQGPYTLKVGQTISIPFKNVFPQTMQFSYSINSSAFSVRAPETLKAKKTCNMQVTYDAKQAEPNQTKTGKLVVTGQHSARTTALQGQTPPPYSWVYYLKGTAA